MDRPKYIRSQTAWPSNRSTLASPASLWIATLLAKRWWAPSKPISRAMVRLRNGARSVGMACRMVF